jgi:hypothetical protein
MLSFSVYLESDPCVRPTRLMACVCLLPLSPLFATHTRCSQLAENSNTLSPAFATHTDLSPASPVFATHTKTTGVYPNNSHSGTHAPSSLKITPHSFHELTNYPFRNSFPLTSLQMPGGMGPVAASFLKDYFNFSVVFPNLPTCKPSSLLTVLSSPHRVCSPGADMLGFRLQKSPGPAPRKSQRCARLFSSVSLLQLFGAERLSGKNEAMARTTKQRTRNT